MSEHLPPLVALLFAYAVSFGIQNKVPFLYRSEWLHGFLSCTYCVGFHTGWMTWLMAWAVMGKTPAEGWQIVPSVLMWALTSAAFCFAFDALVQYLENNAAIGGGDADDDD
jgi:hypothetical protein